MLNWELTDKTSLTCSGETPISANLVLKLQVEHYAHLVLMWVLGLQTPFLMFVRQASYPPSISPAPSRDFFFFKTIEAYFFFLNKSFEFRLQGFYTALTER